MSLGPARLLSFALLSSFLGAYTDDLLSICRYTVLSILLPFPPNTQKRTLRVRGERTTFQGLINVLGEVEGVKYKTTYLPVDGARVEEEKARRAEDEAGQMAWSLRTLGASGYAIVGEPLENDKFGFKPESVRQAFERVYGVRNG
jgi:hypothetical protein